MKNYRKILSILMALILALSTIPVSLSASAAQTETPSVGDNPITRENGIVDPAYPDYEYLPTGNGAKIVYYNGEGGDVTIPARLGGYTVTCIGSSFAGPLAQKFKSVVIPDTVNTIENMAFYYANNLTSVTLPASLTSIGDMAFEKCSLLKTVTLPDSVENIGNMAFVDCAALETVVFPSALKEIGRMAFNRCKALKNAELPGSVTTIGERAFGSCPSLEKIFIPASVTEIGSEAFVLGSDAFPKFDDTSGNKRELPEDMRVSIIVDPANKVYDSRDNCNAIIETATNTLLDGCSKTVIPDSVTAIDSCAFRGSTGLKQVELPAGLNSIGESAFMGCKELTGVVIPDQVTEIPAEAFYGCSALTSVTFPEGLTRIGWYAFFCCDSLKSVTVPASVEYIGNEAFGYHRVYEKDDIHNKWGWYIKIMDDFTMYGYYGTGADRYAAYPSYEEDHIRFIGLNEMPTGKKVKADLSDGMLLEVNDLTGTPTTDKYGEPHDYRDDYPNRTVIGIYDITLWSADHRAVTRPEEPVTVRIRCSQPDAKVYVAGYDNDLNAVYENGWLVFSVDRITRFAVVAGADVVLPVCGDIDGDGELSVYDVTIIQRYEAGMTVKSDAEMILHADVNGDGATDVFDATYVQRYLVLMDPPYPIGEKF